LPFPTNLQPVNLQLATFNLQLATFKPATRLSSVDIHRLIAHQRLEIAAQRA
jgi:hypothetical protein